MWAAGVRAIGEEVLFRGSRTRFRPPAGGAGHASEQWRREGALLLPRCVLDGCISHNTPYPYIGHDTRHWMTAVCRVLAGDSICLGILRVAFALYPRSVDVVASVIAYLTILNPAAPSYPTWKSAVLDPSFIVSSRLARLSHCIASHRIPSARFPGLVSRISPLCLISPGAHTTGSPPHLNASNLGHPPQRLSPAASSIPCSSSHPPPPKRLQPPRFLNSKLFALPILQT
jgi:hypothetical protein